MLRSLVCVLACVLFVPFVIGAQPQAYGPDSSYVFPQKVVPEGFDTWNFSAYYFNAGKVYNLMSIPVNRLKGQIRSIALDPAGRYYAVLYGKNGKEKVEVFGMWDTDRQGTRVGIPDMVPKAICWSADGEILYIAGDASVIMYRMSNGQQNRKELSETEDKTLTSIVADKRGEYLFLAYKDWLGVPGVNAVAVLNVADPSDSRIKFLVVKDKINAMKVSEDGSQLGIITASGRMSIYNTRSFDVDFELDALGLGTDCAIHPDGKYVAAVSGPGRIVIVNTLNPDDRRYIDTEQEGIAGLEFVREKDGRIYLLYNTSASMVYEPVSALAPFYTRLLHDELEARMDEWMQQMPGESLEDYRLRVNEETKAEQMKLFEQEIATRMADNMLEASTVTLDNFNTESNKLEVSFDNMPPIYLDVPSEEVNDFMDPGQLEFNNTLYGLNERDEFEVIYTEVYNPQSGKTYTFDNREREQLDYLASDDGFVPLELVQMSNMEEMRLQEIKDNIIDRSLDQNIISEHTKVAVSTKVLSDVDEAGEKIVNYQVGFSYNVEKGFSEREDFAPGQYRTDNSGAAKSLAEIIQTAFTNEFAQYMAPGRRLVVTITGMADRLRINNSIPYDGIYGEFENVTVNGEDGPFQMTVTSRTGIRENEQLAFVRAAGIKDYLTQHISQLRDMNVEYRYNIMISEGVGGEHRRISVDFLFVDVF